MKLAPIVLFTYNRPWHTEQTLNALQLNTLASESALYVYCDGAKTNATLDDLKKIDDVRTLVKSVHGFKAVYIIEREYNLGLANSVIQGVTEVIEKHSKVIVLEDDIVAGTHFLQFMNDGLELYESDSKVFGITGFKYPSVKAIERSTYFLPIASSWSYATWLNRWNTVNFNGEELLNEVNKKGLKNNLNFGSYPFYEMLQNQIIGKNNSWAIRFYVSMFLQDAIFLYPNITLVENIGFDNSGTHCGEDNFFTKNRFSNTKIDVLKQDVVLNDHIVNLVRESFKLEKATINTTSSKLSNFIFRVKQKIKNNIKNINHTNNCY